MPVLKHCCNPLGKKNHSRICKAVIKVSEKFRELFAEEIGHGKFICKSCHTGLKQKKMRSVCRTDGINNYGEDSCVVRVSEEVSNRLETLSRSIDSGNCDEQFELDDREHQKVVIAALNRALPSLGQAIIPRNWRERSVFEKRKMIENIKEAIDRSLSDPEDCSDINCLVQEIKEKLKSANELSDKIQLLTMLPKSWSIAKILKTFNVPYYIARQAYWIHQEEGIGASVLKRTRRSSILHTSAQYRRLARTTRSTQRAHHSTLSVATSQNN
ncbi:uncharacterized protein LOC107048497 [Diachasma alloeum]|uniref:uncharacterized protein LOC107048497 n=1 Tax=Diachasma alloeum TaxID=454923 RepID=UPI000738321A|nr:uncharacterized protein LOC107048497 [Diachasma alloeum]